MMQSMNLQTILCEPIKKREEMILKEMKKIDEIKEANRLKEKSVVPEKKRLKNVYFHNKVCRYNQSFKSMGRNEHELHIKGFFSKKKNIKYKNIIKLYEYLQINRYKNL